MKKIQIIALLSFALFSHSEAQAAKYTTEQLSDAGSECDLKGNAKTCADTAKMANALCLQGTNIDACDLVCLFGEGFKLKPKAYCDRLKTLCLKDKKNDIACKPFKTQPKK